MVYPSRLKRPVRLKPPSFDWRACAEYKKNLHPGILSAGFFSAGCRVLFWWPVSAARCRGLFWRPASGTESTAYFFAGPFLAGAAFLGAAVFLGAAAFLAGAAFLGAAVFLGATVFVVAGTCTAFSAGAALHFRCFYRFCSFRCRFYCFADFAAAFIGLRSSWSVFVGWLHTSSGP